jgi:hypothetical protein
MGIEMLMNGAKLHVIGGATVTLKLDDEFGHFHDYSMLPNEGGDETCTSVGCNFLMAKFQNKASPVVSSCIDFYNPTRAGLRPS